VKYSAEDATVVIGNGADETIALPVPVGTEIAIDVTGLHYNRESPCPADLVRWFTESHVARYWEDPFTFKPERFMGEWDKDAFVPFSGGARACIGRG